MKEKNEVARLKKFKKESGWSYLVLSNHLKIHYQTLFSWFSGECNPSPRMTKRIQKFLSSIEKSTAAEDLER